MRPNPFYRPSVFMAAAQLARLLPRRWLLAQAARIGRLACRRLPSHREAVRDNLSAIPNLSPDRSDEVVEAVFENFLQSLADYSLCGASGMPEVGRLVTDWNGRPHLERAMASGQGVLLVTAHLGNWELGAPLLASMDFPITVVTLEEATPELTRWREAYRKKFGVRTVTIGSDPFAFVEITRTLERGEMVAMLVDRPYQKSATISRLFGRPTFFSTGPAALWRHTGAKVVPAFILKTGQEGYRALTLEEVPFRNEATDAVNTQMLADQIAGVIQAHPDQWYHFVPIWLEAEDSSAPPAE